MIFEKSSTRTRVSFDIAIRQLGGTSIVMDSGSMQLGRGETVADTAKVLSRMCDAIMIRTDDHAKVEELAANATVPVINGLTDLSHPCQIVARPADSYRTWQSSSRYEVAWLGDGNNVLNSIVEAAGLMKFNVRIGCPEGYDPDQSFIAAAQAAGAKISVHRDALEAADSADVVVADTWCRWGRPMQIAKVDAMMPFQVNDVIMEKAKKDAVFLHCLLLIAVKR